jgi:hypothetical protein
MAPSTRSSKRSNQTIRQYEGDVANHASKIQRLSDEQGEGVEAVAKRTNGISISTYDHLGPRRVSNDIELVDLATAVKGAQDEGDVANHASKIPRLSDEQGEGVEAVAKRTIGISISTYDHLGPRRVSTDNNDNDDNDDYLPVESFPSAFFRSSDTSVQAELDHIVASVGNGVVWSDLVQYGEIHGHVQGRAIRCDAPTLMDITSSIFLSFEPLRDDVEDPCKTLLQTTIWKMLVKDYNLSSSEAISYVANIAWFERVPYKLPYDADRSGNQKEFQVILDNTDPDMKVIHEQVIKSLPNLKSGLVLGNRGTEYFIDEVIVPGPILSHQLDGKNLTHPEIFVCNRACTDERISLLNAMSGFLAKMLGVEALAISEDDAKFYLHSRPLTRAEAEKRRVIILCQW